MPNTPGEEHADDPINTQSENSTDKIIPAINTETISPKQEIENMEVHKHPHHVTHKKKWGEYLLEFFMLFLAIFLGFLAENLREQIVEHHREKVYIHSLVEDLKSDIIQSDQVLIK